MSNAAVKDDSQHNYTRTLFAITFHRSNWPVFQRMLEQARLVIPHLTPDDMASAIINAALREHGDRIPPLPMLPANSLTPNS